MGRCAELLSRFYEALLEDLLESVEGKLLAVFGDHQVSEQPRCGDRSADDAVFGGKLGGENGCFHRLFAGLLCSEGHRTRRAADDEPPEVPRGRS